MFSKTYKLLGLPLAAALVACSSANPGGGNDVANAGDPNGEAPAQAAAGGGASPPRIAEWRRSGPSLLARRSGRLAVSGGCLMLTGEGGSATLPIFPEGSASLSADGTALSFGGKRYAVGDSIELSGGAISAKEAGRRGIVPPAGCPAEAMFLVN